MSIYSEFGVKRVVNAAFAFTRLGGSTIHPEVEKAMLDANKSYANMWELMSKGSEYIAKQTGAEAAWITSGGFNGLVLSAAACITGKDPEKLRRLPHTDGMKNEIIVQRANRSLIYDRSMEVPGGRFVFVGDETFGCGPEEFEAAFTDKTAAIHYLHPTGPARRGVIPLKDLLKVAHKHGIPVIVDSCGVTYPPSSFKQWREWGVDLACFGGKYVQGPNSTGFILGRKDLVEAVSLHSFIGAESGPEEKPNYWKGVGRGYKLDRQEVIGLLAAFRRWVTMDHQKERIDPAWQRTHYIEKRIRKLPGLKDARINFIPRSGEGIGYHSVGLSISFPDRTAEEVGAMTRKLREKDPEVWVRHYAGGTEFGVNALFLLPGEEKIVAERFAEVFA